MPATLVTIPFSHFCEKARWALELCGVPYEEDGHLPMFHYVAARRAGALRRLFELGTDLQQRARNQPHAVGQPDDGEGDPQADVAALGNAVFVMKAGKVYRSNAGKEALH